MVVMNENSPNEFTNTFSVVLRLSKKRKYCFLADFINGNFWPSPALVKLAKLVEDWTHKLKVPSSNPEKGL